MQGFVLSKLPQYIMIYQNTDEFVSGISFMDVIDFLVDTGIYFTEAEPELVSGVAILELALSLSNKYVEDLLPLHLHAKALFACAFGNMRLGKLHRAYVIFVHAQKVYATLLLNDPKRFVPEYVKCTLNRICILERVPNFDLRKKIKLLKNTYKVVRDNAQKRFRKKSVLMMVLLGSLYSMNIQIGCHTLADRYLKEAEKIIAVINKKELQQHRMYIQSLSLPFDFK
jgi:hypothetical protein